MIPNKVGSGPPCALDKNVAATMNMKKTMYAKGTSVATKTATEHLLQRDRRLHLAGQIPIIEFVRVPNPLIRHQLDELAAKRMAPPGREIRERHPIPAAHPRIHLMHLARKPIRRQPLHHRIR